MRKRWLVAGGERGTQDTKNHKRLRREEFQWPLVRRPRAKWANEMRDRCQGGGQKCDNWNEL